MSATHVTEAISLNTSAVDAILHASVIVQCVIAVLFLMSVISWGIIIMKHMHIDTLKNKDLKFEEFFWRAKSLDDIFAALDDYEGSSMASVFRAGYLELRKLADSSAESVKSTPVLRGIDNLERSLRKAVDGELIRVESNLNFLATTGSTGPFIGLFGTVWGIMGAFKKIGATGMASLAVVAPGISEALIATAIGLFAAIPATMAYNHFVSKMKRIELYLNSFSADFLNIAKRNFFKES